MLLRIKISANSLNSLSMNRIGEVFILLKASEFVHFCRCNMRRDLSCQLICFVINNLFHRCNMRRDLSCQYKVTGCKLCITGCNMRRDLKFKWSAADYLYTVSNNT